LPSLCHRFVTLELIQTYLNRIGKILRLAHYDLLRTVHISSASAATRPSTSARTEYFQMPIRSRNIVALSIS
jgi:hypothetical protein